DAIGTALGCLGGAFDRLGLSFWGTAVVSGLSWLTSGLRTAAQGLGAAADTALDPNGYQIRIDGPAHPEDIARALLDEASACLECGITGTAEYTHGSGSGTLVTFGPADGPTLEVAAVMVATDGTVEWWGADHDTIMYDYEPIGQDASGNIFIHYNPGRYDGVQVIVPSLGDANAGAAADVVARMGGYGNYAPRYAQAYYDAEVIDVDNDGIWEIRNFASICEPTCAQRTLTFEDYWLEGSIYAPRR